MRHLMFQFCGDYLKVLQGGGKSAAAANENQQDAKDHPQQEQQHYFSNVVVGEREFGSLVVDRHFVMNAVLRFLPLSKSIAETSLAA
ncbi:hypothetical protein ACA910_013795 [Epithemia clementina (nom. ined.)]